MPGLTESGILGVRRIGEQWYLEEYRSFNFVQTIATNGQFVATGLQLPGAAPFILKGMARGSIAAGSLVERRFLFRFGNSAGDKWYSEAGIQATTELTLDVLIFGDGRFPYPVFPHITFDHAAQITMEIEDISNTTPYDIYMSFIGSYLLPIAGPEVLNTLMLRGSAAERFLAPGGGGSG